MPILISPRTFPQSPPPHTTTTPPPPPPPPSATTSTSKNKWVAAAEAGKAYSYSAPTSPASKLEGHPSSHRYGRRIPDEDFKIGSFVLVRCNQTKWLLGQVRRVTNTGIRVWIGAAQVLVHVPSALPPRHLVVDYHHFVAPSVSSSSSSSISSCPSSPRLHLHTDQTFAPLQIVRPAHLSHRQLYRPIIVPATPAESCLGNSEPNRCTMARPEVGDELNSRAPSGKSIDSAAVHHPSTECNDAHLFGLNDRISLTSGPYGQSQHGPGKDTPFSMIRFSSPYNPMQIAPNKAAEFRGRSGLPLCTPGQACAQDLLQKNCSLWDGTSIDQIHEACTNPPAPGFCSTAENAFSAQIVTTTNKKDVSIAEARRAFRFPAATESGVKKENGMDLEGIHIFFKERRSILTRCLTLDGPKYQAEEVPNPFEDAGANNKWVTVIQNGLDVRKQKPKRMPYV